MESMCQKQREEINKYKTHVGELSSQLWSVGEKLLIEQQQKQEAMQRLKEVQVKFKEIEIDPPQLSTIARRTSKYVQTYWNMLETNIFKSLLEEKYTGNT